jgi:fluoride exporter
VTTALLVFVGGAVGAPLRYITDRWVQAHHLLRFPLGTLVVNLAGCFVAGVVAGGVARAGWSSAVQGLFEIGLCGGLTTYSTFSVETIELLQGRLTVRALGYVITSVGLGVGLAALGWAIA